MILAINDKNMGILSFNFSINLININNVWIQEKSKKGR